MSASVPIYAPCDGGLILNSNKFALLERPGVATVLRNYEVAIKGGYRRINGYVAFGAGSATRPDGETPILGIHPYALGVVVCAGTDVFYSEDGVTWTQINKDTGEVGDTEGNLPGLPTLSRANQGLAEFVLARGTIDHATNPNGVLYIATGPNSVAHFHIDGTGGSRTFTFVELTIPTAGELLANHDHHLCVVDTTNAPNTVSISASDDYDNFTGGLSGDVVLPEKIIGIRSFRNDLYIFSENSINRLININDSATLEIVPVTGNIGCIDGKTIQEIGGDLLFLAPDGFRTIAGTARISDVELGSVSKDIQPLVNEIIEDKELYVFSSTVIRSKNQYRMFYIDSAGVGHGITGTLRVSDEGVLGYQWSELRDIGVHSVTSGFDDDGVEILYHGDEAGFVYLHDQGNDFDGSNIEYQYQSPDAHYGDLGLRKTLHYFNVSLELEGILALTVRVTFDFNSGQVAQPPSFVIDNTTSATLIGSFILGTDPLGVTATPLDRVSLMGSGSSVAFSFAGEDSNAPFIIHGYHIEIMPSGRK